MLIRIDNMNRAISPFANNCQMAAVMDKVASCEHLARLIKQGDFLDVFLSYFRVRDCQYLFLTYNSILYNTTLYTVFLPIYVFEVSLGDG